MSLVPAAGDGAPAGTFSHGHGEPLAAAAPSEARTTVASARTSDANVQSASHQPSLPAPRATRQAKPATAPEAATPLPDRGKVIRARRPSHAPEIVDPIISSLLRNDNAARRRASWQPAQRASGSNSRGDASSLLSGRKANNPATTSSSHRLVAARKGANSSGDAARSRRPNMPPSPASPAVGRTSVSPAAPALPKVSAPGEVMARTRLDTLYPSQRRQSSPRSANLPRSTPSPASVLPESYQPPPTQLAHPGQDGPAAGPSRGLRSIPSHAPTLPRQPDSTDAGWNPPAALAGVEPRHVPVPARARIQLSNPTD